MSKGKNRSTRLPAKSKPNIYIGDPGPQLGTYVNAKLVRGLLQEDIEAILAGMTEEELFNTAISVGVKATEALGIERCIEHLSMKVLEGQSISKLNYATDVVYCKQCMSMFYLKSQA